jgi:hypothetical protein
MKRTQYEAIILFILIFLIMFSSPLTAGEIYVWKDKNGVECITTTPPPENAKVSHQEKFQPTDRSEIEAYQRKRKAETDRREREYQSKRRAYEYEQTFKNISESYEGNNRKRAIEYAKETYNREREWLEKYQDHRRNSGRYGQDIWNDAIKSQEKEVEKARRKLYDLENN